MSRRPAAPGGEAAAFGTPWYTNQIPDVGRLHLGPLGAMTGGPKRPLPNNRTVDEWLKRIVKPKPNPEPLAPVPPLANPSLGLLVAKINNAVHSMNMQFLWDITYARDEDYLRTIARYAAGTAAHAKDLKLPPPKTYIFPLKYFAKTWIYLRVLVALRSPQDLKNRGVPSQSALLTDVFNVEIGLPKNDTEIIDAATQHGQFNLEERMDLQHWKAQLPNAAKQTASSALPSNHRDVAIAELVNWLWSRMEEEGGNASMARLWMDTTMGTSGPDLVDSSVPDT